MAAEGLAPPPGSTTMVRLASPRLVTSVEVLGESVSTPSPPSNTTTPGAGALGSGVNESSGSGGDALPWMFHTSKAGTLVGKRTWGGLVGIGGFPQLIDGGAIMAPRAALYGIKGEWEVENHGVAPDVEVDMDPKLVREGHDPQLEKAVAIAMEQLAKNPTPKYPRPAYPDYHQKLPPDRKSGAEGLSVSNG